MKRYATVRQIAEQYPAFSECGLRWIIHNKKTNGFEKCIIRIGRKLVIDLDEFENWLENCKNQETYKYNKKEENNHD